MDEGLGQVLSGGGRRGALPPPPPPRERERRALAWDEVLLSMSGHAEPEDQRGRAGEYEPLAWAVLVAAAAVVAIVWLVVSWLAG